MNLSRLTINLEDLLRHRTVEIDRIEYKTGWNPDPIFRTLCAFANDFENLGGGYIIIGQECMNGQPVFPPMGVPESQLDKIQRELLQCCHLIQPAYFPLLSIETVAGRKLIILWSPGGQNRPYKVPKQVTGNLKDNRYYIRRYANTVEAKNGELRELMTLTATVPFDDRICQRADLDDIRLPPIRSYLKEIKSGLCANAAQMSLADLGRQMNVVEGGDEYLKPRSVGLMFFFESPETFFPGTQIDVVIFPKGAGGGELIEKQFNGPLHQQVRDALRYCQNNVIKEKVTKIRGRAEAKRVFNYPYEAVEEALVNTIYHRSYEQREPVEVRVNPDGIEIISYPGPDPSIKIESLNREKIIARRYRNRRIGEFLKELKLTEGRCTGIPTMRTSMKANGSPPPKFKTDVERTYFFVELPIHPDFKKAHDESEPRAHEEEPAPLTTTELRIVTALKGGTRSRQEIVAELGYSSRSGFLYKATARLRQMGLIELTVPNKPRSRNQRMRLTDKGRHLVASLDRHKGGRRK
jgi:ATP-dependent DNA helicase RecG